MNPAYHIRVCAVGSKQQLERLVRAMMQNTSLLQEDDDPEAAPAPLNLASAVEALHTLAAEEGGRSDGFLYEMLCRNPFGSADPTDARLTVREEACGEWTACFDYHSRDPLQPEDWRRIQRQSDQILLCAQYACTDPERERGRVLLCAGKALDNWDSIDECWFWLTSQYLSGLTPQDLSAKLQEISELPDFEDGPSPQELISGCEKNLRLLTQQIACPDRIAGELQEAAAAGNWGRVIDLRVAIAESVLWETEHYPKWLACLQAAREAWLGRI